MTIFIGVTGHRPTSLPCGYNEDHPFCVQTKLMIRKYLNTRAIEYPHVRVITGMALGFDTWVAESALCIGIPVIAYLPFRNHGNNWRPESKNRHDMILGQCTQVKVFNEEFKKSHYLQRDRHVVEDCEELFALYDGRKTGGTHYTVKYAIELGKNFFNIYDKIKI